MKSENLDRILGAEEELVPSSGFMASVMERVQEEAAAPAPIPFPWKRIVPAMGIAAGLLGWCGVELVRHGSEGVQRAADLVPHANVLAGSMENAGWVAASLGVALFSWLLTRRLMGRSGLL